MRRVNQRRPFTPEEAAGYTGLPIDVIHGLIHRRMIPYTMRPLIGTHRKYFIDKMDLDHWIERRQKMWRKLSERGLLP